MDWLKEQNEVQIETTENEILYNYPTIKTIHCKHGVLISISLAKVYIFLDLDL